MNIYLIKIQKKISKLEQRQKILIQLKNELNISNIPELELVTTQLVISNQKKDQISKYKEPKYVIQKKLENELEEIWIIQEEIFKDFYELYTKKRTLSNGGAEYPDEAN